MTDLTGSDLFIFSCYLAVIHETVFNPTEYRAKVKKQKL